MSQIIATYAAPSITIRERDDIEVPIENEPLSVRNVTNEQIAQAIEQGIVALYRGQVTVNASVTRTDR